MRTLSIRLKVLLGVLFVLAVSFFWLNEEWITSLRRPVDRTILLRLTDRTTRAEVRQMMRAGGWYQTRSYFVDRETWKAGKELFVVHYDKDGKAYAAYFAKDSSDDFRFSIDHLLNRFFYRVRE
ncbi:MAG: hypothetical protein ACRC7O_07050 [Fimbriiglobus sp.]